MTSYQAFSSWWGRSDNAESYEDGKLFGEILELNEIRGVLLLLLG